MPHPDRAKPAFLFADISSNNAGFDAGAYARAGHLLIAIKATEGNTFVNPDWQTWSIAAHRARLAVMHYHFCTGVSPIAEAAHLWNTIRLGFNPRIDRIAIDFEQPAISRLGSRGPAYLAELDQQIHKLSGVWSIGYTFASELSPQLQVHSRKWWVASFGNKWPAGRFRKLPAGTMWAWQFTDGTAGADGPRGAAGIGRCDVSVLSPPIVSLLKHSLRR